jgi:hypothetical protein
LLLNLFRAQDEQFACANPVLVGGMGFDQIRAKLSEKHIAGLEAICLNITFRSRAFMALQ